MRRRPWKHLLLAALSTTLLLVTACGEHRQSELTSPTPAQESFKGTPAPGASVLVCHEDDNGDHHVISVNIHAWPAHEAHGDVMLVDADGDGYVAAENACVPGGDCNDNDPSIHPGAQEQCDGKDNDCNGLVDEGMQPIGVQSVDILRAPSRVFESAMGNLVADAMRARFVDAEAALTNSGGLRADLLKAPPVAGEGVGEILCRELFSVLPFGNKAVVLTLTGAQLQQALLNGVSPHCNPIISTGRFPQVAGLKVTYACNGTAPVILGMWKTPQGINGPQIPIGPNDTIRLVTNDFMYTGGDGYTVLQQGTDVVQSNETLLELLSEYVMGHSPVSAFVEGRIQEIQ